MGRKIGLIFLFMGFSLWGQTIVTTNEWTGAFVKMAGGYSTSLAPPEMIHPPEYELTPGDILTLKNADYIVFAGYEGMVKTIKRGLDLSEERLISIKTGYNYSLVESSVLKIARLLNTEEAAKEKLKVYQASLAYYKAKLEVLGLLEEPTLVHFHHQSIASELGLNVVGVFGPGPVSPQTMLEYKDKGVVRIIDNGHNPVGKVFKGSLEGVKYFEFINFPPPGMASLEDVVRWNLDQLLRSPG